MTVSIKLQKHFFYLSLLVHLNSVIHKILAAMFLGFFFSFSIFPFFLIILVNYISKLANNQDDASSSDKIKLLIKVY